MQILIPYASWLPGAADELPLPQLHALLSKMQLLRQDIRPEVAFFYLKHEDDIAAAYGLGGAAQGRIPSAALQRWRLGLKPEAAEVWAQISLCHWQIGMNDGQLRPGAQLAVDAPEAEQIWHDLRPLLAEHGLELADYPVLPPYARHVRVQGVFADLPCPSVARVAGQELSTWLPRAAPHSPAAQLQSLLTEVQMLLYQHPANDARATRRQPALNSLWLEGVGALPQSFTAHAPSREIHILSDLQQAAESGNLAAWREAWLRLEREQVPTWQAALQAGEDVHITLCGLRSSASFSPAPRTWRVSMAQAWQRWRSKDQAVHWPSALADEVSKH